MLLRFLLVAVTAWLFAALSSVSAERSILIAAERLALRAKLDSIVQEAFFASSQWSPQSTLSALMRTSGSGNSTITSNDGFILPPVPDWIKKAEKLLKLLLEEVTTPCQQDLYVLLDDLRPKLNRTMWAFTYFDSTGKLGSGLAYGNIALLGSINQCLENNGTDQGYPFNPHYCTASIGDATGQNNSVAVPDMAQATLAVALGLCLPITCSDKDVMTFSNNLLTYTLDHFNKTKDVKVLLTQCYSNDDTITWDSSSIISVVILGITVFLLLAGTFIDAALTAAARFRAESAGVSAGIISTRSDALLPIDKQHGLIRLLVCWSILRNGRKLLAVETAKSVRSDVPPLHSVHGIRFISMCWVIYAHAYIFNIQSLKDPVRFINAVGEWWFQGISNASFSVDTFFFLAGMLLAYVVTAQAEQHKRINWIQYYVHRYWRLTPPYILTLLVVGGLLKYMGSGPFWQPGVYFPNQCKDTWWTNLLYVNNFVHLFDGCMQWSWYLANDMQFYVFSPLIIIPFFYRRWLGMIAWALCLAGFFAATITLTVTYGLPADMASAMRDMGKGGEAQQRFMNYFSMYYVKPWTRVGPYLVGVAFGYLIFKAKTRQWRMKTWQALLGWPVVVAASAAIIFSLQEETSGVTRLSPDAASLYNILTRPAWAMLLGFIVLACETGAGGFAATILSYQGFVPLSRLAYCTYLIHPAVMVLVYESMATSFAFSHITIGLFAFGFIFASFGCGFIVSLMFESPALALERLLTSVMNPGRSRRQRVVAITPPSAVLHHMPGSSGTITVGSYDVNAPIVVIGGGGGSPSLLRRFAATPPEKAEIDGGDDFKRHVN